MLDLARTQTPRGVLAIGWRPFMRVDFLRLTHGQRDARIFYSF